MSIPSPIVLYNLSDATMKGLLPAGYTPLAYIESTGTLWINTETTINGTVYTQGKIMPVNISGERDWIGNYNNSTSGGFVVGLYNSKHYSYSSNGGATNNGAIEANVIYEHYALFTSSSGNLIANGITYSGSARTVTPNNTVTLFRRGDANCYWYGRVYFARLWQDNILKGDWRPARRDSDGVIGMYDLVSRTFKTNSGSGSFIAGPPLAIGKGGGKSLPEEYLLVEYIHSDGNQYIDTNYIPGNNNLEIDMIGTTDTNAPSTNRSFYGASSGTWNPLFNVCNGHWEVGFGNYWAVGTIPSTGGYYITKLIASGGTNQTFIVNGETLVNNLSRSYTATNGPKWFLFRINNLFPMIGSIHYMKITENGTVVRHFFPCYRKSDMKPGMYDTVNGVFYTNSGSGEFILGPTITNCYTWEPNAGTDGYEFYDYILSDGNQYINTGIPLSTRINSTQAWYNLTLATTFIMFGGENAGYYTYVDYCESNGYKRVYYYGKGVSSSEAFVANRDYYTSTIRNSDNSYTATYRDANGGTLTLTTGANANPPSSSSYNFFLFAYNNSGNAGYKPKCKMYHYQIITDSLSTSRDYWPCKRKSDGAIGMFDLFNKVFYTNSGSGAFTAGTITSKPYEMYPGLYTNVSSAYDSSKGWVVNFNKSTALLTGESPSNDVRSVSFWMKPNALTSGGLDILLVDYKSRIGFGKLVNGNWCTSTVVNTSLFTTSISANNWYHIVIVNDGSSNTATNRKLYVNGVLQSAASATENWNSPGDRLDIGKRSSSSDGFNGQISNFMLFDTALTAAQVKELYGK